MKPHAEYDYNYFRLFQGVCGLVLACGLVILAINHRAAISRGLRLLGAWYRSRRGDVLGVSFLAGTLLLAWGWSWLRWILTHTPE